MGCGNQGTWELEALEKSDLYTLYSISLCSILNKHFPFVFFFRNQPQFRFTYQPYFLQLLIF